MDTWFGVNGGTIAELRGHGGFPDNPDASLTVPTLEAPRERADNYGVRLRTFLVPWETGEYTFWIASDDNGELWIAPDVDPAGAVRVAHVPEWTDWRQWDRFAEQRSAPIALEAGQAVYVEALMNEGGGGDHLSIAWALGDGPPALIDPASLFTEVPPPAPEGGAPELSFADTYWTPGTGHDGQPGNNGVGGGGGGGGGGAAVIPPRGGAGGGGGAGGCGGGPGQGGGGGGASVAVLAANSAGLQLHRCRLQSGDGGVGGASGPGGPGGAGGGGGGGGEGARAFSCGGLAGPADGGPGGNGGSGGQGGPGQSGGGGVSFALVCLDGAVDVLDSELLFGAPGAPGPGGGSRGAVGRAASGFGCD